MKQVIPAFLHASEKHFAEEGELPYEFRVWPSDMSAAGYIPLGRSEVEFEVPTYDQIVARHAVLLRAKIAEVAKEAAKQTADLREQLSKLESLTYTPPSGEGA